MTTMSANGIPGSDPGSDGDWGWFSPRRAAGSGPSAVPHGTPPATPSAAAPAAATPPAAAPGRAPAPHAAGAAPPTADAALIRRTMAEIEPAADAVTSYFYALLFVRHPELRDLFPTAMDAQRDRLFKALLTASQHVEDVDVLTDYLSALGRGHRKYGTRPEHYPAVGECLIGTLSRYATASWSPQTEAAWVRAYTVISQIMIDAAAEDEEHAPAWWDAEIVAHEARTDDIAVITVRPDQPYPFLAGQYTTLETPWWPRVWRHYSFASAPRSDGLLSFHVKAVPAGWVSGALVRRARPGDVLRLGPPAGSMTVDHRTDNGLLCLGGGTGIAPIKALVEDVAEHGRARPVEVFYGARSDHDLYDLETMLRLESRLPWLSVRPVVADGCPVRAAGLAGRLPDAVRGAGRWSAYDGFVSGPPGMIRSGVDALVGVGIPTHRIRHDSLHELVAQAAGD
ncbi:globin domain-containing protein [Streptomyces sp. TRM 70351]|uniref:globin domain-containing protein n=1 Tax=Streptomyces sp. TRM 70351 TaxID=3116552 RepID=UPI002E7B11D9|nr:globin domain-containing protein [Streptomyces sp. TRM 70351]MEE1929989.1 globin domain-containing protein [Streptomyces sp. TRM 70351]